MRRERVLESSRDDLTFGKRLLLGGELSLAIQGIFVDRRLERREIFRQENSRSKLRESLRDKEDRFFFLVVIFYLC